MIKKQQKKRFYFQCFNITQSKTGPCPLWRTHTKRSLDEIYCPYKIKQSHWLLCAAENCDWSRKITTQSNLTRVNDLPVTGYPCYAQRTLGLPGGKHRKSLGGNIWRKVVSMSKTTILGRHQCFLAFVSSIGKEGSEHRRLSVRIIRTLKPSTDA